VVALIVVRNIVTMAVHAKEGRKMPKPKTVTVYLRVCRYVWCPFAINEYRVAMQKKYLDRNKCCRIIPYKLKVPKERKR